MNGTNFTISYPKPQAFARGASVYRDEPPRILGEV
jgi:hypothetical protein